MSSANADGAWPPRTRSLVFRLAVWYAATLLLAFTLMGVVAIYGVRLAVERSRQVVVHERLERQSAVLAQVGLPRFAAAVTAAGEVEGEHGPVRVRDAAGHTLFRQGDVEATVFESSSVSRDLVLDVASPVDPWSRVGRSLTAAVVLVVLGCLIIGVLGGARLTRRALRPVAALAATARAVIQSGDLSRRVDTSEPGSGDLRQLAALVNRMLERNQTLVRSMREALDNVAHDLRTPLTRLRGIAEVALSTEDPASAREALGDCIEESDRALVMLRTLMDISEAEAGIMRLERGTVDLRAAAAEAVDLYAEVAEDAGVALTAEPGEPVTVHADPNRIRQALANLVDNALKYTPRGGHVSVAVRPDAAAGEASLVVRDDGIGIPPESIPRIWDRLYRVDPSRATRGLGLGLSLVKAIAVAHAGRVSVDSTPQQGSTFTFTLPRS
jgi:signal transduction histidine kinase